MMRVPINALLKPARPLARRARPGARLLIAALTLAPLAALVCVLFATPAIDWLPPPDEAGSLLGPLLGAQAAIAALTLAVTLFVMQGVSGRPDADDRMYREYIRRSWVRPIFWSSIVAVGVTGLALLAEELGTGAPLVGSSPGLRNLPLLAAIAFLVNLGLPVLLFEQAIRLAQPDRWRMLRRELNERAVRAAVQAFLDRHRRVTGQRETDEPNWADMFPGSEEGSAEEAIRALLDDARRSMDERRQADFKTALDSIKGLVTYAMDEIEREGIGWGIPGSQPQWPPLRELGRNLYPFREDVIRRGNRDYASDLLSLDYWLRSRAVDHRCGEFFTVAVGGDRWNCEIATRVGNPELSKMFRDRSWLVADMTLSALSAEEAFPYAKHLVKHHEQLLSDALHADRLGDYEELARGFDNFLRMTRLGWNVEDWPPPESARLFEQLEQHYRITLMGLGGRAIILASEGRIADAGAYLEAARDKYARPQQLSDDIAEALTHEDRRSLFLWLDWEGEGAQPFESRSVDPARYPLTFFSVRLLELATGPMRDLDLHGCAKQALDWFAANSEDLERDVRDDPDASMERRQEIALGALRDAVRRDKVAEDEDIIRRELSAERIAAFTADVYAAAFTANTIERLFIRADALLYLPSDQDAGPLRGARRQLPKGALARAPDDARIGYALLNDGSWGRGLAEGVTKRLCEAVDDGPSSAALLGSSQELLRAIDGALESLSPRGEVIVLLAGDWHEVTVDLRLRPPDGYLPEWQVPEADRCGETGRYLGHPIVRGPHDGDRRLYVVEPGEWGCFVRAQVEGDRDLRVEVDAISLERARKLLSANPNSFSKEPDEASKLRKWQTFVEIDVAARTEFRVIDPSRARRVIDS